MSYTVVKNSAGTEFVVSNTVKNSIGALIPVTTDVNDSDGNPFTIFDTGVYANPLTGKTFYVTHNRLFVI